VTSPRSEDDNPVDVFALRQAELLSYALGLQDELRALRAVLTESLQRVHEMTLEARRRDTRIRTLVTELRDLRDRASVLRGRLHHHEEAA
jgi:hypothetical protein